ncbi:MAG: tetratricopeptide repeat protein, partial [Chloroflexota bacterium]
QIHIQADEINKAIALYELALSQPASEEDADLLSDLGYLYHQMGKLKRAVEVYGRSLQLYPQSATTLLLRGMALLNLKRNQAALRDFNEAIRLSPYLDNAYWGRGQVFIALEDYSWAVASFTRAIELNPDEPEYYESRAKGFRAMGKISEANVDLQAFEKRSTL